jgi:hypothetical protein
MDVKEKRKQYYINNRDKISTNSKQDYNDNRLVRLQYYYDDIDIRKKYNSIIGLYMVLNILNKN